MAEPDLAEADQLAFFAAACEGYDRASAGTETVKHSYRVAGFTVELRFAGPALVPLVAPALAHLEIDQVDAPDLTIDLFDSASSGARLPLLLEKFVDLIRLRWWECLGNRREISGLNGPRISSVFHLGPDILSVLDRETNRAVYWVEDASSIPYYEKGYPLTALLNGWLAAQGKYFVHAACFGLDERAVLLTGKGGSGKSTTSLACLNSALRIVADDYCVVDPATYEVFSLYNTIKLKGLSDVERFSYLKPCISNLDDVEDDEDGEKAMIFLQEHFPQRLMTHAHLRAILVPRIANQPHTEFQPISAAQVFKALVPSTIFQLPGNAHNEFRALAQLVRDLPSWEVALGSDIEAIPDAILSFLQQGK